MEAPSTRPTAKDLARLIGWDGGIFLQGRFVHKPLWFSDVRFASVTTNQWPAAATLIANERFASTKISRAQGGPLTAASMSAGIDFSADYALLKAMGEGVERLCGQIVNPRRHRVVAGSYAQLRERFDVEHPRRFCSLSDEQYAAHERVGPAAGESPQPEFGLRRFDEQTPMRWVAVEELTSGEPALIPLAAGFLRTPLATQDEMVVEPLSSGLACHGSLAAATIGGLCELIERDAFVGMWLRRLRPPNVDLASLRAAHPVLDRLLGEFACTTFELTLHDLTSDLGIPVFLATLCSEERPYGILGAGCHPDSGIAVEKALYEIHMALVGMTELRGGLGHADANASVPDEVGTMFEHSEIYADRDLRERLAFYRTTPTSPYADRSMSTGSEDETLARLLEICSARGYRVYRNDLTIPEVEREGLHVVKVYAPGLLPLYCYERNRPLGMARLREYEAIFPASADSGAINPWLHPFP